MMMNLPCLWGSCSNFLRPIYHILSASQAPRRGHAPRWKPMPATALVFVFDLLLTCIRLSWYWFTQWTLYHYGLLLVFCRCSPFRTPSFMGFCSRTLSSLRCIPSATRQSSGVTSFILFTMLPLVPVKLPDVWYLSKVSADHKLSLSSELCKSPSVSCRLSQPVTASFSVDCCFGLCNTRAAVWIHPHATLLTLPPETASNAVSCVLCGWSLSVLYAFTNCMPPAPFHLTSGFPLRHQTCWSVMKESLSFSANLPFVSKSRQV